LFCFVLNYFLDWFVFFFISTPRYLFSFNFYVKFSPNSFNCYFFNHFLNGFVFYNSIHKHLISFDFSLNIQFHLNFMLNLVLILLIAFFFCYVFLLIFFSILSLNICLINNFFFLGLLLMGSPWSNDMDHKFKGLARVDFYPLWKQFFEYFFMLFFFCFPIYKVISISCLRSCVWFVYPVWLLGLLEAFFVFFFFTLTSF